MVSVARGKQNDDSHIGTDVPKITTLQKQVFNGM
jgi:hypothetical protein